MTFLDYLKQLFKLLLHPTINLLKFVLIKGSFYLFKNIT